MPKDSHLRALAALSHRLASRASAPERVHNQIPRRIIVCEVDIVRTQQRRNPCRFLYNAGQVAVEGGNVLDRSIK